MEIYYEELAYAFVGTEKSYVLPPATWRPRRASAVISVQAQRPGQQWCQYQFKGRRRWMP